MSPSDRTTCRRLPGRPSGRSVAAQACAVASLWLLTACGQDEQPTGQVVVDITIRDGEVSPAGEEIEATVGEPIELRVDSDVAEELHVHTSPDKSFEVKPTGGQVFTLTFDEPGQVELETEEAGVLVAELVVRP